LPTVRGDEKREGLYAVKKVGDLFPKRERGGTRIQGGGVGIRGKG